MTCLLIDITLLLTYLSLSLSVQLSLGHWWNLSIQLYSVQVSLFLTTCIPSYSFQFISIHVSFFQISLFVFFSFFQSVHFKVCIVMLLAGLLMVWSIYPHLRFCIYIPIGYCFLICHKHSSPTVFFHQMLRILLRQ